MAAALAHPQRAEIEDDVVDHDEERRGVGSGGGQSLLDRIAAAVHEGLRLDEYERLVVVGHAFRNALIPLVTIFGLMLAGVIAGAVIIESLFGIPGVGLLMVTALNQRDYPVVLAITVMAAFAYIALNLVVDISYRFIDPRIRYK